MTPADPALPPEWKFPLYFFIFFLNPSLREGFKKKKNGIFY